MVSTRSGSRSERTTGRSTSVDDVPNESHAKTSSIVHDDSSPPSPPKRRTRAASERTKSQAAAKENSASERNVELDASTSPPTTPGKNRKTSVVESDDDLDNGEDVDRANSGHGAPKSGKKNSSAVRPVQEDRPPGPADFSVLNEENSSAFLRRHEAMNRLCRQVIFDSYRDQSTTEFGADVSNQHLIPKRRGHFVRRLGPVVLLDVGPHFDSDQLWEEIELRNKPLLSHVQRRLRNIQLSHNATTEEKKNRGNPTRDEEHAGIEKERGETPPDGSVDSPPSGFVEESEPEDEQTNPQLGASDVCPTQQAESPVKRRVTFASDQRDPLTSDGINDKTTLNNDAIEDGFFSLADMEMFADDAEQLAIAGKLMESDDEETADDSAASMPVATSRLSERGERLRYADFFDPPSKGDNEAAAQTLAEPSRPLTSIEDDQFSDENAVHTPLTATRTRTRQIISAIEEENVSKKPWQLRGEVSGHARPKDSLLGADMDHDSAARPGLLTGTEKNETIEDIVRQRITDGLFDDVVRSFSVPPDTEQKQRRDALPEVSQEKPTEGLADVYARDFMLAKENALNKEHSQEVSKELENESPEQKEVNRLYEKLSGKLDALAGLQFAPSGNKAQSEMNVHGNLMALRSEEAIPEGVSDATVLTPRETYSVERKALTGEREVTKNERKAARSKSKRGKKSARLAKERAGQLMQESHPLRLAKRRAEEALLRRGKKIRSAEPQPNAVKAPSSYFATPNKGGTAFEGELGQEPVRAASSLIL